MEVGYFLNDILDVSLVDDPTPRSAPHLWRSPGIELFVGSNFSQTLAGARFKLAVVFKSC